MIYWIKWRNYAESRFFYLLPPPSSYMFADYKMGFKSNSINQGNQSQSLKEYISSECTLYSVQLHWYRNVLFYNSINSEPKIYRKW